MLSEPRAAYSQLRRARTATGMVALTDAQTAAYVAFLKTKRESYSLTRAHPGRNDAEDDRTVSDLHFSGTYSTMLLCDVFDVC